MVALKDLVFINLVALAANGASVPRASQKVQSLLDPNISLSFKETHICETTPGVKSYSGYVNLPANAAEGRPYDVHTFFWFFEARKDAKNAPLSLWLQGGPGSPSIPAALGENGPCLVTPDSADTVLNPWSWNNEVNMLYIDQPVQTGFSYDKLVNATVDETALPFIFTPLSPSSPPPKLNATTLLGLLPSQDPLSTANTTTTAAAAAWHFMQIWMQQFPKYRPRNNQFSIWSESYGGHYGPTFADYFTKQNAVVKGAVPLRLDTIGIVNGCIDMMTQMPFYPEFAVNNTYGIRALNQTEYSSAVSAWPECKSLISACRDVAAAKDPNNTGTIPEVNKACADTFAFCYGKMHKRVQDQGYNVFDITAKVPGSFPPKYAAGYLNTATIQEALGVPLNFSGLSYAASSAFTKTGDFVLGHNLAVLGKMVDDGVKVALVYGDRDYQCNWYGGEQISLAMESRLSGEFRKAGYAEIRTEDKKKIGAKEKVQGYVRQHGGLSFSRVLDAGHEAPWYQPETTYRIFQRVMFNRDVATGKEGNDEKRKVTTKGPASVRQVRNQVPVQEVSECYFWDMFETCTPTQIAMFRNETAIAKDYIMVGYTNVDGTKVLY